MISKPLDRAAITRYDGPSCTSQQNGSPTMKTALLAASLLATSSASMLPFHQGGDLSTVFRDRRRAEKLAQRDEKMAAAQAKRDRKAAKRAGTIMRMTAE